jgi:hypothetical protein
MACHLHYYYYFYYYYYYYYINKCKTQNLKNIKQFFFCQNNNKMAMAVFQLDIRPATRIAGVAALYHLKNSAPSDPRPNILRIGSSARNITRPGKGLAVTKNAEKNNKKPDACTADELHYVTVSDSEWKLALWRYLPSPKVLVLALAADAFVLFNERIFFFFELFDHVFRFIGKAKEPSAAAVIWGWN